MKPVHRQCPHCQPAQLPRVALDGTDSARLPLHLSQGAREEAMTTREQTWDVLQEALAEIVYTRDVPPKGGRFWLERDDASNWAVLHVYTYNVNTYDPEQMRHTNHEFVVPVATYRKSAWTRWVFDRIVSIEIHETCESFQVKTVGFHGGTHYRPYAPHHGNGEDPYAFWPGGTAEQKRKAPGED